jgi:hypothetical protein
MEGLTYLPQFRCRLFSGFLKSLPTSNLSTGWLDGQLLTIEQRTNLLLPFLAQTRLRLYVMRLTIPAFSCRFMNNNNLAEKNQRRTYRFPRSLSYQLTARILPDDSVEKSFYWTFCRGVFFLTGETPGPGD